MINIKKIDKGLYVLVLFCQKSNENTDLYEIKVGKSERQTITIRICRDCLCGFIEKCVFIGIENQA